MIQLRNLNKYDSTGPKKQYILHDLSLTVGDSESVVIQGTPDAGKSILLRILGCMDQFDSGSYLLDGIEIGSLNNRTSAKLRRSKIGFVSLHPSLNNHRTVLMNAMRPLLFSWVSSRKRKSLAIEALRRVGLEQLAQEKANRLSEGQRRRDFCRRKVVLQDGKIVQDLTFLL